MREQSKPISADTGLADIQQIAEKGAFKAAASKGEYQLKEDKTAYIDHLISLYWRQRVTTFDSGC